MYAKWGDGLLTVEVPTLDAWTDACLLEAERCLRVLLGVEPREIGVVGAAVDIEVGATPTTRLALLTENWIDSHGSGRWGREVSLAVGHRREQLPTLRLDINVLDFDTGIYPFWRYEDPDAKRAAFRARVAPLLAAFPTWTASVNTYKDDDSVGPLIEAHFAEDRVTPLDWRAIYDGALAAVRDVERTYGRDP